LHAGSCCSASTQRIRQEDATLGGEPRPTRQSPHADLCVSVALAIG
jgi:hypothetical protein